MTHACTMLTTTMCEYNCLMVFTIVWLTGLMLIVTLYVCEMFAMSGELWSMFKWL